MIKGKVALKVNDTESDLWFLVNAMESRKAERILDKAWDDWYKNDEDITLDEWLRGRLYVNGIKYIATRRE